MCCLVRSQRQECVGGWGHANSTTAPDVACPGNDNFNICSTLWAHKGVQFPSFCACVPCCCIIFPFHLECLSCCCSTFSLHHKQHQTLLTNRPVLLVSVLWQYGGNLGRGKIGTQALAGLISSLHDCELAGLSPHDSSTEARSIIFNWLII